MTYIHYGSDAFIPEYFQPVQNNQFYSIKPEGGLWASPKNGRFTWKDFCEGDNFQTEALEYSFEFELKPNAKILEIKTITDLNRVPATDSNGKRYYSSFQESSEGIFLDQKKFMEYMSEVQRYGMNYKIDFVEINKEYDAVYVDGADIYLHWALYGWDCETLLILNPDVIVPLEESSK
jgi:hypothetical protein